MVYNDDFQLTTAANTLLCKSNRDNNETGLDDTFREIEPMGWDKVIFKKMYDKPYKERLIIAGALIAAEIDRLLQLECNKD